MAAVISLMARDRKLQNLSLAHQLLVYPGMFHKPATESAIQFANGIEAPTLALKRN